VVGDVGLDLNLDRVPVLGEAERPNGRNLRRVGRTTEISRPSGTWPNDRDIETFEDLDERPKSQDLRGLGRTTECQDLRFDLLRKLSILLLFLQSSNLKQSLLSRPPTPEAIPAKTCTLTHSSVAFLPPFLI